MAKSDAASTCPDCGGHGWLMEPGPDRATPNQVGCERCNGTGHISSAAKSSDAEGGWAAEERGADSSGVGVRHAASDQDNPALWLAYEFQAFRERTRAELEALTKWANENRNGSHEFIANAWADQVSMWAQSHLARLTEYEEKLDA